MRAFELTCCSTVDLPLSYFQARDIPFICYHYSINGKDYPDDLGQTMPIATFYKMIEEGAMPTTTQINATHFKEFFEPILQSGKDVLHLTLSSGISGTYGSAYAACAELSAKYPERKIYVIDSLAASSGYGLLVDAAADMRDAGASIDETRDWVEQNKLRLHHWFFTTDLKHLKRGGRVSATSAALGTLLNICPLMNVDVIGKLTPRTKCRGKKNVIQAMVSRMEQFATDRTNYSGKCFISNSACLADAQQVAALVEARFPRLQGKVMINDIGTVIGAHTGPGTVALFFFGDPRVD